MPADAFAAVAALVRAEAARRPAPASPTPLSTDGSHPFTTPERRPGRPAPNPAPARPDLAPSPRRAAALLSGVQRRLLALLH
ncbi:hypothetical protein ACIRP2_35425 [Streptomyces sp. NPDC101194]|uniref:hypothetical protein n=1 Tax=Streptomyces sp. NPDC101194 TaxID=3366127 RepID=UPI00382273F3